jgi:segregation and condensation protein A
MTMNPAAVIEENLSDRIYKVRLENVFEGPMDLLIHLIRKNEVDIYDIPIALLTDQYLKYLEWMKAMNIDFAGDFLLMAATLTQIKSKMLLPVHEDDEEEDPRLEITRPLLEYLQFKAAAESLSKRELLGDAAFVRKASPAVIPPATGEELVRIGLFELIDAFQRILAKAPPDHQVDLTQEGISVKDRMTEIVDLLEKKGSATFDELFSPEPGRSEIVVTFLALLELAKMNLIRMAQHVQSGIIRLFYQ